MDLFIIERKHHLDLFRHIPEHLVGLDPCHEGKDIRLHNPQLCLRLSINEVDVVDGAIGGKHIQLKVVLLGQLFKIQAKLVVGSLFTSSRDAQFHRVGLTRQSQYGNQDESKLHRPVSHGSPSSLTPARQSLQPATAGLKGISGQIF